MQWTSHADIKKALKSARWNLGIILGILRIIYLGGGILI